MKLMIDDAVWGFAEIFSEFGEVITLPGREINRQSLIDCEILIVRSRTKVNSDLLKEWSKLREVCWKNRMLSEKIIFFFRIFSELIIG